MARRNFIKAYNDMMSGSGQSNASGLNMSASGRTFPREVDCVSRQTFMTPQKDKSYPSRYVVSQKQAIPNPNSPSKIQTSDAWSDLKPEMRNVFVDIDGEESLAKGENTKEVRVIDTSHKIKRHISLVDLARPYGPRTQSSVKETVENREIEKVPIPAIPAVTRTLPKGFSDADRPYVMPKFTPSFREMIETKSKKDTLVSITESTPPSMQKWAVEWNSEPKHSMSIAELKDDIIRERNERQVSGNDKPKDIIFAEEETIFDGEASRSKQESMNPGLLERSANYTKPTESGSFHNNITHDGSDFDLLSKMSESSKYMQGLKQNAAQNPQNIENTKDLALDWLPQKYENMKRVFKGKSKDRYSFKRVVQETSNDGTELTIEPIKKPPKESSTTNVQLSFDEDRRQFHQWFRERLSRKGDRNDNVSDKRNQFFGIDGNIDSVLYGNNPYSATDRRSGTESITYSEGDPTMKHLKGKSVRKNSNVNDQSVGEYRPNKDVDKTAVEVREPVQQYEKSSSFYYWLKQRGLVNLMKNKPPEKPKPANVENVKEEPKFPWSTSYMCKYVPKTSTEKKVKSEAKVKKEIKPRSRNSTRKTIPLRKAVTQTFPKRRISGKKVKSQSILKRVEANKSRFEWEEKEDKKKKRNDDVMEGMEDLQPGRVPYHGWIVGNELEHVKNLRLMEYNHASPGVTNRKKLFPSLHDKISTSSMDYWESKFSQPLTQLQDDEFYSKSSGNVAQSEFNDRTPAENGRFMKSTKPLDLPSLFFNGTDFIDISDDPISSLKSLLNDPKDPMGFTLASKAEDQSNQTSLSDGQLPRKVGKMLPVGKPTLIAKLSKASKIPKKDSPLQLQFARNTEIKTPLRIESSGEKQDSTNNQENDCSIQGLEAERNELDDNWLQMISPKGFNFDYDTDLVQHLKTSPECKAER